VNDKGNLSKQMEYARLLEKENRFFCVRCIAAEAFPVLGEMRPRWDPGVRQWWRPTKTALCGKRRHTPRRGKEAHQPPPESECIPFAVAGEKVFRHTFSHSF